VALLHFQKHISGFLVPASPDTSDFLQTRLQPGDLLSCDFKRTRNPAFHRRFFALLNIGFQYWEPVGGAVSASERRIITAYANWLSRYGVSSQTMADAAETFLKETAERRSAYSACKSFDAFRAWVTVEAGFFEIVSLPDGTARKIPKSISFARMDENEFHQVYRSALDVLWRWILFRTFKNPDEAERAAAQLMNFSG